MQERTLGVTVISLQMLTQGSTVVRKADIELEIIRETTKIKQEWSRSSVVPASVTTRVLNLVYWFQCPYFRKDTVVKVVQIIKQLFACLIYCYPDLLVSKSVQVFPVLEWTYIHFLHVVSQAGDLWFSSFLAFSCFSSHWILSPFITSVVQLVAGLTFK